jgi:hypothetical protein
VDQLITQVGIPAIVVILLLRELKPYILKGKETPPPEADPGICGRHVEIKEQMVERKHINDCTSDMKIAQLEAEKTMDNKIEKAVTPIHEEISTLAAGQEQVASEVTQINAQLPDMAEALKIIANKA